MKKLMSLMLGMALAFTTVAVSFAQETKKEEPKKKKGKKKTEPTPPRRKAPAKSGFLKHFAGKPRSRRCAAIRPTFLTPP